MIKLEVPPRDVLIELLGEALHEEFRLCVITKGYNYESGLRVAVSEFIERRS